MYGGATASDSWLVQLGLAQDGARPSLELDSPKIAEGRSMTRLSGVAVSVFGLGYVGCVSAACLAARGHRVTGVDVNAEKVTCIGQGLSPVVEERMGELIADAVAAGDLTVSADVVGAVMDSDISLICVGTPSGAGGRLSTTYLEQVTGEIGNALAKKDAWHVVVYRSTMVPGTCESLLIPLLEQKSGRRAGVDFGVCVNPEFLREGSSVSDFFDPAKTVVGQTESRSGDMVMALYDGLPGIRSQVSVTVAEMTKYVDNSFHALKVGYANEIGAICSSLGVDSHAVMDIFLSDTKLNISTAYLRPGFSFGGSCLPKDVRALVHVARLNDVDVPLLSNLLPSNESHLRRAVDLVISCHRHRIGIFGLAFKTGTDDLRESPMVELAERLAGKGFYVEIYDKNVKLSRLVGANRSYIGEQIPHIGKMLIDDVEEVIEHSEVIVVGTRDPAVLDLIDSIDTSDQSRQIIDLVGVPKTRAMRAHPSYQGIAW
jgi:GDP-mannose 6-dehydrogenase